MANKLSLITFLFATVVVASCGKEPTTAPPLEKVQTDPKPMARDMKDFTFAQKSEFVIAMQAKVTTLDLNLDKLSAKIDGSSDAVKAETRPKLLALRDQKARLNQQLADAGNATESTWEDVKAGTKKTSDALANSFAEASQWMGDKIAP